KVLSLGAGRRRSDETDLLPQERNLPRLIIKCIFQNFYKISLYILCALCYDIWETRDKRL
ncbi:MAG: hypothetical protein LUD54_07560, partial [Oscillospiraceae bacterium]|nr:hypothetical protein [Oscillospiraceae bacterium]